MTTDNKAADEKAREIAKKWHAEWANPRGTLNLHQILINAVSEGIESQRKTIEQKDAELDRWRNHFDVASKSCQSSLNKIQQLQTEHDTLLNENTRLQERVKELESAILAYKRYIDSGRANTIVACPECPKMYTTTPKG